MSWADLDIAGVHCTPSPVESARFGVSMARLVVGMRSGQGDDTDQVCRLLTCAPEVVVVVRWPADRPHLGAAALASGRVLLPADTLVYWEIEATALARSAPGSGREEQARDLWSRSAGEVPDAGALVADLVRATFTGYPNHYAANPLLDPGLALDGYVEWARSTLDARPEDVWLLGRGRTPMAVASLCSDPTGNDLEILLAGVVPQARRAGHYARLLADVGAEAVRRGAGRVVISTQAGNASVQRRWAALGLRPYAAVTTTHALLPRAWQEAIVAGGAGGAGAAGGADPRERTVG